MYALLTLIWTGYRYGVEAAKKGVVVLFCCEASRVRTLVYRYL